MGNYYETFYPPFFMDSRNKYDSIAINPKGWDRDDKDILADFTNRISAVGNIDTKDVEVRCEHQVISLNGTVATQTVLVFLEHVADNVLGVRDVKNQLQLRRAGATFLDHREPLEDSVDAPAQKNTDQPVLATRNAE